MIITLRTDSTCNNYNIITTDKFPAQAVILFNKPPHSVSYNGITHFGWYSYSQSVKRKSVFSVIKNQSFFYNGLTLIISPSEIAVFFNRNYFHFSKYRKTVLSASGRKNTSASLTAPSEYFSAVGSTHSFSETVILFSFSYVRLIRSEHSPTPPCLPIPYSRLLAQRYHHSIHNFILFVNIYFSKYKKT